MKSNPANKRRDEFNRMLIQLAEKIELAKIKIAKSHHCQGLVELEAAQLIVDGMLQQVSQNCSKSKINWNACIDAMALIGKVVDKLYSFFNCTQLFLKIYEYWKFNKTPAHCRGRFSNSISIRIRSC